MCGLMNALKSARTRKPNNQRHHQQREWCESVFGKAGVRRRAT